MTNTQEYIVERATNGECGALLVVVPTSPTLASLPCHRSASSHQAVISQTGAWDQLSLTKVGDCSSVLRVCRLNKQIPRGGVDLFGSPLDNLSQGDRDLGRFGTKRVWAVRLRF